VETWSLASLVIERMARLIPTCCGGIIVPAKPAQKIQAVDALFVTQRKTNRI